MLIAFFLWLSVAYPNKFKVAIGKTKFFILGIALYVIVSNFASFSFKMGQDPSLNDTERFNSSLICYSENDLDFTTDCFTVINRAVLPCILIFIFNALSIQKMSNRHKKFKSVSNKSTNFMRSIIGMNIVFLVIYLPWGLIFMVYHINNYITNDSAGVSSSSFVNTLLFQLIFSLCDCISYFNNISPFFFNLAFNSIFRNEIMYLFTRKRVNVLVVSTTNVKKSSAIVGN